jgi:hypothetical protein
MAGMDDGGRASVPPLGARLKPEPPGPVVAGLTPYAHDPTLGLADDIGHEAFAESRDERDGRVEAHGGAGRHVDGNNSDSRRR